MLLRIICVNPVRHCFNLLTHTAFALRGLVPLPASKAPQRPDAPAPSLHDAQAAEVPNHMNPNHKPHVVGSCHHLKVGNKNPFL